MKKINKRLLSLFLAGIMLLAFVACSGDAPSPSGNDPQLEAFVEEGGDEFLESFVASFEESSGLQCKADIKVEGTAFIVDCFILNVDNVPESAKKQMQEAYDSDKDSLKPAFSLIKVMAPKLSAVIFNVNEEDGDNIAKVTLEY